MTRIITNLPDLLTVIHGLEKMNAKYNVLVHPETAEKPRHYIVELEIEEQKIEG